MMTDEQLMRMFDALTGAGKRIDQGLTRVAQAQLEDSRRIWATERLILAMAAVAAERSGDPLAYMERLRFLSLDGLSTDDSGRTDDMRKPLEERLAQIEAFVARLPPP